MCIPRGQHQRQKRHSSDTRLGISPCSEQACSAKEGRFGHKQLEVSVCTYLAEKNSCPQHQPWYLLLKVTNTHTHTSSPRSFKLWQEKRAPQWDKLGPNAELLGGAAKGAHANGDARDAKSCLTGLETGYAAVDFLDACTLSSYVQHKPAHQQQHKPGTARSFRRFVVFFLVHLEVRFSRLRSFVRSLERCRRLLLGRL